MNLRFDRPMLRKNGIFLETSAFERSLMNFFTEQTDSRDVYLIEKSGGIRLASVVKIFWRFHEFCSQS